MLNFQFTLAALNDVKLIFLDYPTQTKLVLICFNSSFFLFLNFRSLSLRMEPSLLKTSKKSWMERKTTPRELQNLYWKRGRGAPGHSPQAQQLRCTELWIYCIVYSTTRLLTHFGKIIVSKKAMKFFCQFGERKEGDAYLVSCHGFSLLMGGLPPRFKKFVLWVLYGLGAI